MGSNAQRRRESRERAQQERRAEEARLKRRNTVFGIGLAVIVVLGVGGVVWAVQNGSTEQQPEPAAIQGVETFNFAAGDHTTDEVTYVQTPPAGGQHDPTWQNCGIYSEPVRDENAVHSLEHGAVWITYDPELSKSKVSALEDRIDGNYLLLSPYPGQDSPVVLTAWNTQLRLDSADDPRFDDFITTYRQGPQTPEPGASCDGGTSETLGS